MPENALCTGAHTCSAVMLLFFISTVQSCQELLCRALYVQVQLPQLFPWNRSLFLLSLVCLPWELSQHADTEAA